jgi:protein phosphatase
LTYTTAKLTLRYAAHTDRGLVRRDNLDSAWACDGLLAVADGFGPSSPNTRASATAIEAMVTAPVAGTLQETVEGAVQRATDAVQELINSDGALHGGGTTLTALAWSDTELALVHIGDSRAYLLRGGDLLQLTHDDTVVQGLIDKGELTEREAALHPKRAVLTRALHGGHTDPPAVLTQYDPRPGDRYLLCSDGVHTVLPPVVLRDALLYRPDPAAAIHELFSLVHRGGAPDNIAAVVAVVTSAPS